MRHPVNANPHDHDLLSGFVDEPAMRAVSAAILRQAEGLAGLPPTLDCAAVTGFSGPALAELARLIRDLRQAGTRLALANLDDRVSAAIPERLVEDFLLPTLERYAAPAPGWTADRFRPSAN